MNNNACTQSNLDVVEKDETKAFELYKKSAENSDSFSACRKYIFR